MASDDLGLAQSPAQAAEGDVRAAAEALLRMLDQMARAERRTAVRSWSPTSPLAKGIEALRTALSADAAATIAAARLAAEEMRERAAEDERDRLLAIANRQRYTPVSVWLVRNGAVPPSYRAIFRERDRKAAATPTIADPDGEARS